MNKRTMIGIAAGAAVLAGAALYIAKKRSDAKTNGNNTDDAKQNFKSKLNELQRKAGKELKGVADETKEAVNAARDRANEWVNNASKA
jgi:hypothetical protein